MSLIHPRDAHSEGSVVVIDAFPSAALKYQHGYAVVAVDVIRATTTAVTAVVRSRRCFTAPTVDAAFELAQTLENPLLAGEIGGNMPFEFEMDNSPAEIDTRTDVERPVILVTSSGTLLIHNASLSGNAYIACFRNVAPTVRHLAQHHRRVAVIGAGSRGEFREEDQACCAMVARGLMNLGFDAGGEETLRLVEHWDRAPADAWLASNSVRFLQRTGQERDLEFILSHRADLDQVFRVDGGEVHAVASTVGTPGFGAHSDAAVAPDRGAGAS